MFRVRAGYALMLGVLLAAVAQAQQPMPGMMQGPMGPGPMMQGPMGPGPMMQGPMMLPAVAPMGGQMAPAMGPMFQGPPNAAPVNFHSDIQPTGFAAPGGYGDCGCGGGGCDGGCFGGHHGYQGYGCDACGGGGCGACCPPPGCPVCFNGEVEATILLPDLRGNSVNGTFASPTVPALATFASMDSELDEQDVLLSPRIWLHAQKCEWGLGLRVWYLDETESDFTPLDQLQLNIFSASTSERLYLLTTDAELTYSWHGHQHGGWGGASYQLGVGMRYLDMEHESIAFGSALLDDVIAGTNGIATTDFEAIGITSGFRGTVPLWRHAHLYWKIRGSYMHGDVQARTQTYASAVGIGDAAAGVTTAGALSDDDLFIGEAQLGIQWQHDLVCVPARCFFRTAFEFQHWEFDSAIGATSNVTVNVATVPGTIASANTSATAVAPDIDLFGLSIAAGLTW